MAKQSTPSTFYWAAAFIVAVVALNSTLTIDRSAPVAGMPLDLTGEHAYFRPSGDDVSGFKGAAATYHRSPCPALNTLANHGFLPRDGKALTPEILSQALVEVYNIDPSMAGLLVDGLPAQFTLADLGEHHYLEHDASLIHDDSYKGRDPSQVNSTLANDLLSRGDNNQHITRMSLAVHRRKREEDSAANTPDFAEGFTAQRALVSYSETAVLLLCMGDYATATISVDHARCFLVDERIPEDFTKSKTPITMFWSVWVLAEIKALALLSYLWA
ncbi:hypothetical protein BBJ28_00006574 [Nothophytophthora sp. Chile5]|nr:hypothetical protein BBJ28_00006574 [Nothophytophthora sp. Chile5]